MRTSHGVNELSPGFAQVQAGELSEAAPSADHKLQP
jgi:hypothetical protein